MLVQKNNNNTTLGNMPPLRHLKYITSHRIGTFRLLSTSHRIGTFKKMEPQLRKWLRQMGLRVILKGCFLD